MQSFVGGSGSGKTTLLNLLLGFYPSVSGEILIGNMLLSQAGFKQWRSHCGVVTQDGYIFNDTIARNITPTPRNSTRMGTPKRELVLPAIILTNSRRETINTTLSTEK
ncbi:MAG: ATP-binding cassette domain-containing protein, partial [Bacteroidales bacterium]|nr:ATP-binding cassette domain-containing protein [Bacteroidales bacterium]